MTQLSVSQPGSDVTPHMSHEMLKLSGSWSVTITFIDSLSRFARLSHFPHF